nr:hypothetical protein [Nostoc sp. DedQUE02]
MTIAVAANVYKFVKRKTLGKADYRDFIFTNLATLYVKKIPTSSKKCW